MTIKKDSSGHRSIEVEVEVPGTPEEVWKAIATGPGISSWFVPSTVEEKVDGEAKSNFGPGMESVGKVKVWSPPGKLEIETVEESGKVATEWIVEARAGGTCVVRVVHRWFAETDDWDQQFEGHGEGWKAFFRILRLYLTHFSGEPCSQIQLTGFGAEPKSAVWASMFGLLGLTNPAVGTRIVTDPAALSFAGIVERTGESAYPEELLLRLDAPTHGIAHLFAMPMGGQVLLSIRFFLYGPEAAAVAAQVEPSWQAWIAHNFPMVLPGSTNC
ncbi:MAG: SRPBCC domain-containing protein [Planctomyces sp.]|nr:SRPBCC domain-containing protein [Planctomyces sp.]